MSRELNMDTKRLNFWKESIEKEAMARDGINFLVIINKLETLQKVSQS